MPLGVVINLGQIKTGDSAELYAALRLDGQPVSPDQILNVNFIVQKPDGTISTNVGVIQDDGQGFLRWTDTSEPGEYLVQAQFQLMSGETRSVMQNFSVVNPFADEPTPTNVELITGAVWLRLEDLFDSVEGGPWLRDKTLANFDENKIAALIPEALMDINLQMPPSTLDINFFTAGNESPGDMTNPNMPMLVQATLVKTIKHLMRSYVEQPALQGAQVVWQDRQKYQQAWAQIYQVEQTDYIQNVRLWKRTLLNLGRSSLLTYSKSGRLWPYTNQTSRGVWRGYY
jgi:hypothetical protein